MGRADSGRVARGAGRRGRDPAGLGPVGRRAADLPRDPACRDARRHRRLAAPQDAAAASTPHSPSSRVAIVVLACGLAYWVGPRFADEGKQLWSQMSGEIDSLRQRFGSGARPSHVSSGGGLLGSARGLLSSTLGIIGSAFVVLAAAVYFAIAPELYRDGVVSLFPMRHPAARARASWTISAIRCSGGCWARPWTCWWSASSPASGWCCSASRSRWRSRWSPPC